MNLGNVLDQELADILASPEAQRIQAELSAAFDARDATAKCGPDPCHPECNPACQPTCAPRCGPMCDPVKCRPNNCWPKYCGP
jgi:hypothetical protein